MQTLRQDGFLIDLGPNSALETTPFFNSLFKELGIDGERVYADSTGSRRYILRNGALHVMPMSPGAFIGTRLWSTRGKLRLFGELFAGRADHEETIAEFVKRRLGQEFLDYAINPFVAGVYAGNPEQLSVRAAFPKLYALEEKYGGLIRGAIKGRRERRRRAETAKQSARMFSFTNGMNTFPAALARALGGDVVLGAAVEGIERDGEGWKVTYAVNGARMREEASAVVLAAPASQASGLIAGLDAALACSLEQISYPPVAMVFTGFPASSVKRPLDGFGYLVPSKESRTILGTIWSSTIFPNRAPEGHAAFTTFVGGSRQPEILDLDDGKLIDNVTCELQSIIGIQGGPSFTLLQRWEKSIPQYNLGYGEVLRRIDAFEAQHPGLFICSNYRGGIAVGDCVVSADRTARRIGEFFSTRT